MNKINIIIFSVFFIVNTIIFLIIKDYKLFNFLLSECIVFLHFSLRWNVLKSSAKDAFKISHGFITSALTIISFIISIFLNQKPENNIFLLLLVILVAVQFIYTFSSLLLFKKEIL